MHLFPKITNKQNVFIEKNVHYEKVNHVIFFRCCENFYNQYKLARSIGLIDDNNFTATNHWKIFLQSIINNNGGKYPKGNIQFLSIRNTNDKKLESKK